MADPRPILFFDSGMGGLSVLTHVAKALPQAPIVYVADSAGFPYGIRSEDEIAARVPALLGRLAERYAPRLIVIACNTASTIALDPVRAALDIPIVGTVPAIKPAAERSQSRVIGVLGTEATVRQPYVADLASRFAGDCTVLRHGSAALVEIAEAYLGGVAPDPDAVRRELDGLFTQPGGERIDQIVNACTHFPLLEPVMREICSPHISFVDGGPGIARRVAHLVRDASWPATPLPGRAIFTARNDRTEALAPSLAKFGLSHVESL